MAAQREAGASAAGVRGRLLVCAGAAAMSLLLFLALPLIQAIGEAREADTLLRTVDSAVLPPPPPPPEPQPDEPEPEEPPPELIEEAPPLDLAQLELVLNPGAGGNWSGGDLAATLAGLAARREGEDALFSLDDLDQRPRAIYQPGPAPTAETRRKGAGRVYVLFLVDEQGRVEHPIVQKSTDPVFERPALQAVQKWKFEPGRRNGRPVRFRMRVPITFQGRES